MIYPNSKGALLSHYSTFTVISEEPYTLEAFETIE